MGTAELLKKVRKIEIKTKGLSNHIFAGEYHSAFKGRGMTFSEVREYQYGDDVRNIDWNVTARFNKPFVKVFEEEREMTVMLLIDVSGSGDFGSRLRTKAEMITEIASTLAFSTIQNNDKVGVIFFSDRIEKFIPPQKGRKHVLHIIRDLIDIEPAGRRTDIGLALRYFSNIQKRRTTAFLISDFIDSHDYNDDIMVASRKHDLICLHIYDDLEENIPDVGIVKLRDSETGEQVWIDTHDKRLRMQFNNRWGEQQAHLDQIFAKNGIDHVAISTSDDYVKSLIKMFKLRS